MRVIRSLEDQRKGNFFTGYPDFLSHIERNYILITSGENHCSQCVGYILGND